MVESYDHGKNLSDAHVNEIHRALLDRLEVLEREIADLAGRHADGDVLAPRSVGESDETNGSSAGRPNEDAAQALLKALIDYPKLVRERISVRLDRAANNQIKAKLLRGFLSDTVASSRTIHELFAAPRAAEIPSVLPALAREQLVKLGIRTAVPLVTPSVTDEVDVALADALTHFLKPFPASKASEEEQAHSSPTYPVFRIPSNEAASPRWWPVILGHETTHLFLDQLSANWPEDGGEVPPGSWNDKSQAKMLHLVEIFDDFPYIELANLSPEPLPLNMPVVPHTSASAAAQDIPAVARGMEFADRWLTEILCDLFMVRQFGPAAVAALANYIMAMDCYTKHSETHPPGYFRIKTMLAFLGDEIPEFMAGIVEPWILGEEEEAGRETLRASEPPRNLYLEYLEESMPKIRAYVESQCGDVYDLTDPDRQSAVNLACRQLRAGLPPYPAHEREFPDDDPFAPASDSRESGAIDSGDRIAINDVDVINAGWLVAMQRASGRAPDAFTVHENLPIDRLLLKSIETMQLLRRLHADDANTVGDVGIPAAAVGDPTMGAILGVEQIKTRLSTGSVWQRICVTPLIAPQIGGTSIDLRLGNRFIIFQRSSIASFNALAEQNPRAVQRLVERPFTSPFVLHPGEVVLAAALEYVALPEDVGAQVITRSSYGRLGLITATAVQVHPLYRGCLTLELVNLGTVPLTLYPGERVAQLVFFNVATQPAIPAPTQEAVFGGRYTCPTGPEFPSVTPDRWMNRLRPIGD